MKTTTHLALSILILGSFCMNVLSQETELTAFDGSFADLFGHSVAIDGNYAIVGAPLQGGFGTQNAGAAYIYELNGGLWTYQAKLTPPWGGNFGDQFGYSVDISGNYAIVGAINTEIYGKTQAGAAYLFARSGSQWYLVAMLSASDADQNDHFGRRVGVNDLGYSIVGVAENDDHGTSSGSAYIFEPHYGSWVQVQKLIASDAHAGDAFGTDVAIDGTRAVVGAPANVGVPDLQSGAVYVFDRSHYGWTQSARLTHINADVFDHLGESVDIEGTFLIAGAPFADDKTGKAYIFYYDGYVWTQFAQLAPADGAPHDKFGTGVGITAGYAAVGSYLDDDLGDESGSAYLFEQVGTAWNEIAKYTASDGLTGDRLGYRVDIDGTNLIASAHYHNVNAEDDGAAYIFGPAIGPISPCEPIMTLAGVIAPGTYYASDYIQANGIIPATSQVNLVGTNYVALMPNLEIMQGAAVEISLAGCP
jgi:hypothetical protein